MAIYWGSCLASIVFTYIATHTHIKYQRSKDGVLHWLFVTFFSASPLIFLSAIRYNVGADYRAYYDYYMGILDGEGRGRFEVLYYLINKFLAFLDCPPPLLFGAVAALFLMPVYRVIFRDSPYPYLSTFLLLGTTLFFYSLNAQRQMIGAAILLLAVPFLEKKKFIPFAGLVLIASGFHAMCLAFFAVYFLVSLRLTPRKLIEITTIGFLLSEPLSRLAENIIREVGGYYAQYLQSSFAERGQGYVVLCIDAAVVVLSTICFQNNEKFRTYYNFQILALWSSVLTGKIVLVERYRLSFSLASIILLPLAIDKIQNRRIRLIIGAAIVVLYFFYATYTVGIRNSNLVVPYQTIFSKIWEV